MFENIRLSFQGIWSHKLRSILTMLGIIIGIAAIIGIVSLIQGTNDQIKESLVGSGNNSVNIKMYQNGNEVYIYSANDIPFGFREVSDKTREEILALDTVENVTCYNERQMSESTYYMNTALSDCRMLGIDQNYFATCSFSLKTGRNFIPADYENFHKVVILDDTAAGNLFGSENPLGKVVEISKIPFTVVGVVTEKQKSEDLITTISQYYNYRSDSTGKLFMPKACWPIIYTYDEPENVIVKAVTTDDMEKAGQETAEILNKTITASGSEVKYKAENLAEQARKLQNLSNATNMQLIFIAGISLLVGGIGVMNIMLVSVTERTNEIGLKKAIGARKGTILGQFLTEAAMLTSIGGLIGVATGIGAAKIFGKMTGTAAGINIPATVIAVVFSMVIGIAFGFMPSIKAANLDPIEALRRE